MTFLATLLIWAGLFGAASVLVLLIAFLLFTIADWRHDRDAYRRIDRFMAGEERKALREAEMWGQVAELEQSYALPSAEPRA